MVLPAAALIAAAAQAAESGAKAYGSAKQRKEDKRKNKSDFLLELLKQSLESKKSTRNSQNEMSVSRAKQMQDKASEFRKALTGG